MSEEKTFKIVNGDISDGYHTFDELYQHRCLLYLCFLYSGDLHGDVLWVADHYPGWDLVATSVGPSQISYHLPKKYRHFLERFKKVETLDHVFDGHDSADVAVRLERRLWEFLPFSKRVALVTKNESEEP